MSRFPYFLLSVLALTALGALASSCGSDTETFDTVDCCYAGTHYTCGSATAAGECESGNPYNCSRADDACPDGGT